jgi:catechol 2,3-dioxygenase-like lactoylglutathione lyase family enzyme
MNLEQIDHLALRCASPESTRDWYVRILGFEQAWPGVWDDCPIMIRLGTTYLALFPQKEHSPPAKNGQAWHLAFRAATYADFTAAQAELKTHGLSFQFSDHEISHSIYFADPDGFLLEITTYDLEQS